MILPCGAYITIARVGGDANDADATLHLVDFWHSQADHAAGEPPVARHDVWTQWDRPYPDPCSRVVRILNDWCVMGGLSLHAGEHVNNATYKWSDAPDRHGNLSHPSMRSLGVGA
jgi:hypothetical protein